MKLYQKCPICNGVGQVTGGYFDRAGDCDSWMASSVVEPCRVCKGQGIIETPEQQEIKGGKDDN